MPDADRIDWAWLSNDAIEGFKEWRIRIGATSASAASYATGARAFIRHCHQAGLAPTDALTSFRDHMAGGAGLSPAAQSNYRSHAEAFVQFLQESSSAHRSDEPTPATIQETASRSAADELDRADNEPHGNEPPWLAALDRASTPALLASYAQTLEILRARGVLRTANAPLGDFAEWLVWRSFGGTLEPSSTKSHDVTDPDGRRLQVKARLVSSPMRPGQLQTSVFRSWEFDFAVLIQLDERDYSVVRASMIPASIFDEGRSNSKWSEHVRGWNVYMTSDLMLHPLAIDVTTELRTAARLG